MDHSRAKRVLNSANAPLCSRSARWSFQNCSKGPSSSSVRELKSWGRSAIGSQTRTIESFVPDQWQRRTAIEFSCFRGAFVGKFVFCSCAFGPDTQPLKRPGVGVLGLKHI